ncbi:hypothetical protein C8T65DRAFT_743004 [Cerioporus squamosus]|nr:hypothetical protein C8T65DRAFT_743004 [Cerioporus squamosus]
MQSVSGHHIDESPRLSRPHPMTALRNTASPGACQICGSATNYICSACSTPAYYCGPRHILDNWDCHSTQCDGAAIINTHRAMEYSLTVNGDSDYQRVRYRRLMYEESPLADPPPQFDWLTVADARRIVRGLYADPHKNEMTFVDVPIIPRDVGDHEFGYGWVALLCQYLDDPAARTIVSFGRDLEPLPSPIAIYFSVDEYLKGRLLNAPIAALADKSLGSPRPWYGPIVILKVLDDPVTDFGSIEVGDLEHVRAFFTYVQ